MTTISNVDVCPVCGKMRHEHDKHCLCASSERHERSFMPRTVPTYTATIMEFISRARVDLPKLVAALREKLEAEREQEDGRYRAFAQAMRQWEMYADEQREESERIRETTDKEDIEAEMFQRFEATRFAWWKSLLPSSSGGEGMTIKEFYCGFAVAVGTVARNGDPACAVDAMDTNGVALRDLIDAGAEEFDLAPIRHEYKLQARNLDGHKKKLVSSPEVKA